MGGLAESQRAGAGARARAASCGQSRAGRGPGFGVKPRQGLCDVAAQRAPGLRLGSALGSTGSRTGRPAGQGGGVLSVQTRLPRGGRACGWGWDGCRSRNLSSAPSVPDGNAVKPHGVGQSLEENGIVSWVVQNLWFPNRVPRHPGVPQSVLYFQGK